MVAVTLRYTEPLVRAAVRSFWVRTVGKSFWVALLGLGAGLAYLIAIGDRSWYVGAIGAILAAGLLMVVALYVVHMRGSLLRFRRMKVPEAILDARQDRFTISSDVGSSELAWSAVTHVWCFHNYWLLFFSPAQFLTLPLADLDRETRDFILARIRESGGTVA